MGRNNRLLVPLTAANQPRRHPNCGQCYDNAARARLPGAV
jgi:hypothetical protein